MGPQIERGRRGPGAFDGDVLEVVFDKLADARRTVDMRDDLQQEVRYGERRLHHLQVHAVMLVAHRSRSDAHRAIVQRTH